MGIGLTGPGAHEGVGKFDISSSGQGWLRFHGENHFNARVMEGTTNIIGAEKTGTESAVMINAATIWRFMSIAGYKLELGYNSSYRGNL